MKNIRNVGKTGKEKGSIIVLLSLVLLVLVIFITVLLDMARISAAKAKAEDAATLGMNAAMAEYNRTLRDAYGLFTFAPDAASDAERAVKNSVDAGKGMVPMRVSSVEVSIDASSALSDDRNLKGQIIDEMKYLYEYPGMGDEYDAEKMTICYFREMYNCFRAKLLFDKKLAELGVTGADTEAVFTELQSLGNAWYQAIWAEHLPQSYRDEMVMMYEEEMEMMERTPAVSTSPAETPGSDALPEAAAAPAVTFGASPYEQEILDRLENAADWTSGSEETVRAINERSDAFLLAEYASGFFVGKINTRNKMLNGYEYRSIPHVKHTDERAYILTGETRDAAAYYDNMLDDCLFSNNLYRMIMFHGFRAYGQYYENAAERKAGRNAWAKWYEWDVYLTKEFLDLLSEEGHYLQPPSGSGGGEEFGIENRASDSTYFTYEEIEIFFLTRAFLRDAHQTLCRIREVITENMRAAGNGGFRFETSYTKVNIRASFDADTVFPFWDGGAMPSASFTVERDGSYR